MSDRPVEILPDALTTKAGMKLLGNVSRRPELNDFWWPDCYTQNTVKALNHYRQRAARVARDVEADEVCVVVGAGLGPLPIALAGKFQRVYAFEPDFGLFGALRRNVHQTVTNVAFFKDAIGSHVGTVRMQPSSEIGKWRIDPNGKASVMQATIDALELDVDALVVACTYCIHEILAGAQETMARRQVKVYGV